MNKTLGIVMCLDKNNGNIFSEGNQIFSVEQLFSKSYFHFIINSPIINLYNFYCLLWHTWEILKCQ